MPPREPSPDHFAAPFHDTGSSDRLTAPGVGGTRTPAHDEIAGQLARRRNPEVDPRATAALQRGIAQSATRRHRLRGTGTAVTGTPLSIGAGGPEPGFEWLIRRLTVGPLDYSAGSFPTGILVIVAIAGQQSTVFDSGYEVVSSSAAYPAEGTWGRDELALAAGERLRVIITGLTTGMVATIGGEAQETAVNVADRYDL